MDVPSSPVSRRRLIQGAGGTAAALAVAGGSTDPAGAAAPAKNGIFGYGVASGDPTANAVIIWTRATPPPAGGRVAAPGSGLGAPMAVRWEVATDEAMTQVVRQGVVHTDASRDHTVKVDVTGLSPYTRYWYRFSARNQQSVVGRAQTAGDEPGVVHALRLALVSCSNYTGGYFSAYRAIARRDDLDFVLHVGDYLYEYGNGADRYGPPELRGIRDHQPPHETVTLADYRLRHAQHKADPDAQAAHRQHPWITTFDDHEVANDAWAQGAENHQAEEGSFTARRAAAYQAYLEWMPIRLPDRETERVPHRGTRFFRRFTFGALADLSVMETRQNRSKQVGGLLPLDDPATESALADPTRHLPEPEQMQWVKDALAAPTARWHLIGQQVIMTRVVFPGVALGLPDDVKLLNADQWDGYQADQRELIGHAASQPTSAGDTVVLTGDIHSSWASDLVAAPGGGSTPPAGTEFVCPSVTGDGFYELGRSRFPELPPETIVTLVNGVTETIRTQNPWVKYLDGIGHGYTVIDVTPDRVQADFHHTPTPTSAMPDPRLHATGVEPTYNRSFQTLAGTRTVVAATGPLGPRTDLPR